MNYPTGEGDWYRCSFAYGNHEITGLLTKVDLQRLEQPSAQEVLGEFREQFMGRPVERGLHIRDLRVERL